MYIHTLYNVPYVHIYIRTCTLYVYVIIIITHVDILCMILYSHTLVYAQKCIVYNSTLLNCAPYCIAGYMYLCKTLFKNVHVIIITFYALYTTVCEV